MDFGDWNVKDNLAGCPSRFVTYCDLFGFTKSLPASNQSGGRRAPDLWEFYIELVQVEEVFKTLKGIWRSAPSTTDGRKVIMSRYTQPEPELQVLLKQLRWTLPDLPPPRVTSNGEVIK